MRGYWFQLIESVPAREEILASLVEPGRGNMAVAAVDPVLPGELWGGLEGTLCDGGEGRRQDDGGDRTSDFLRTSSIKIVVLNIQNTARLPDRCCERKHLSDSRASHGVGSRGPPAICFAQSLDHAGVLLPRSTRTHAYARGQLAVLRARSCDCEILLDSGTVSRRAQDLTGVRFKRLTVMNRAPNHSRHSAWVCRCVCGQTRVVRANNLRSANTVSCGCWNREAAKNRAAGFHGHRKGARQRTKH